VDESKRSVNLLGEAFLGGIRSVVREELQAALQQNRGENNASLGAPYLTIAEAAQLSRLGESTIRQAIRKRQLKAHKVGERVIIKTTDLQDFLESHPTQVTDD
jgi:excisionase family DNA binding protein